MNIRLVPKRSFANEQERARNESLTQVNTHEFAPVFQALEEMQETAKQLRRAMPTYFSWSEDAVRGTHPVTTTKERAAGACLEVVRCHLDALLDQYDRARAAIDQPQRFFIYFGYWKAPWDVQREMRWASYKHEAEDEPAR